MELGNIFFDQGNRDGAIDQYKKALDFEPAYAAAFAGLGEVYEVQGRDQDAIANQLRAISLSGNDPENVESLSAAFESGGWKGYWQESLRILKSHERQQPSSPLAFAPVYLKLGQREKALEWLERAYREHVPGLVWINARTFWAPMRSYPRFQAILQRMKLPKQ